MTAFQKYWGRCKLRKLVQTPLSKAVKTAWKGHYTPDTDCDNILLRQRTKQVRRIQSLKHRVTSFRPEQYSQLWEEWNAIIKSTGFHGGFTNWILAFEFFSDFDPRAFPTVEVLNDMEQLLIHEIDCQVADIHRIRKNKKLLHENFDLRHQRKKECFKKVREPSPGILQQVEITQEIPVALIQNDGWGLASFSFAKNCYVDATLPATLNGNRVDIVDSTSDGCELMLHDPDIVLEPPLTLRQQKISVTSSAVAEHHTGTSFGRMHLKILTHGMTSKEYSIGFLCTIRLHVTSLRMMFGPMP